MHSESALHDYGRDQVGLGVLNTTTFPSDAQAG